MVLAFGALSGPPPSSETVAKVSGIIAQCPLVRLTHPNGKVTTGVMSVLSKVSPSFQVPAPMPENVSSGVFLACRSAPFLTARDTIEVLA